MEREPVRPITPQHLWIAAHPHYQWIEPYNAVNGIKTSESPTMTEIALAHLTVDSFVQDLLAKMEHHKLHGTKTIADQKVSGAASKQEHSRS